MRKQFSAGLSCYGIARALGQWMCFVADQQAKIHGGASRMQHATSSRVSLASRIAAIEIDTIFSSRNVSYIARPKAIRWCSHCSCICVLVYMHSCTSAFHRRRRSSGLPPCDVLEAWTDMTHRPRYRQCVLDALHASASESIRYKADTVMLSSMQRLYS